MSDLLRPAQWPPKWQAERVCAEFDFGPDLRPGDAIPPEGIQLLITVVDGADASANNVIYGAARLKGARVFQLLDGGVPDAAYLVQCRVTTEQGDILILAGVLRVKALVVS